MAEFRPRANVLQPVLDFVFGYDFFISHSHGDGNDYPKRLQERLQQAGFKVFLDLSEYAPGMDLPRETIRQVKKSRKLLVVARRAALASEWVKREVEVALSEGRIPIIININSAIEDSAATSFIAKTAIERQWFTLNESLDDPDDGPSDDAITSLVRGFKNTRQETKRVQILAGVAAILAITTAVAVWQGFVAVRNSKIAKASEEKAVTERNASVSNESRSLSALSQAASLRGHYADAVMFALAAWPRIGDQERPALQQTIDALSVALPRLRERARIIESTSPKNAKFFMGGDLLVIQPYRGPLEIWNTKTWTRVRTLGNDADEFDSIGSIGGGLIRARMKDHSVRTYDLPSGELQSPIDSQSRRVDEKKFSPTDVSPNLRLITPDECANAGITNFTSPDGSRLLQTCNRKGVIYDLKSSKVLAKISGSSIASEAAFSPDNRLLATVAWNAYGELWDGTTGEKIGDLSGHTDSILSVDISSRNDIVTTSASADPTYATVRLWNGSWPKWRALGRFGNQANKEVALGHSPALSSDGRELLLAGSGYLQTVSLDDLKRHDLITEGTIVFARFCQDRHTIVAIEYSGDTVVVSNPDSRTIVRAKTNASAVSCSPKGDVVAVGDRQGSVRLYSAKTGDPLQVLGQVQDDKVNDVTFSPDGAFVAAAAGKGLKIWKVDSGGGLVSSIEGGSTIEAIGYSANGSEIAIAGDISSATKLFDATSGRLNIALGDAGEIHRAVAFSSDGQRVITPRGKGAVVWDEATGAAVASYGSHEADVIWSSFVKDGKSIVTVSIDGEVRLWDGIVLEAGDAFQVACQRLLDTKVLDQIALTGGLSGLKLICSAGHEPVPFKRGNLSR